MIKQMSTAADDLVKEGLTLLLEHDPSDPPEQNLLDGIQVTLEAVRLIGVQRILEALRDAADFAADVDGGLGPGVDEIRFLSGSLTTFLAGKP